MWRDCHVRWTVKARMKVREPARPTKAPLLARLATCGQQNRKRVAQSVSIRIGHASGLGDDSGMIGLSWISIGRRDLPFEGSNSSKTQYIGMKYTQLIAAMAMLLSAVRVAGAADLPSFDKVSEGYVKVPVADQQNPKGLFNLWTREKDAQLLGELPKNFAGKNYFIALTVSSGDRYAGLQSGDWVVEWRRYDDRLALIAPNLDIRATGDAESKVVGQAIVYRPGAAWTCRS